jgi:tetratricopeptide (TPR) repeat protein
MARRDVLSGAFVLGALLCYLVRLDGRRRALWLAASVASFAASMLSKGWAMAFPLVLLVLDVFPLRRFGREPAGRLLAEKLAYLAVALPLALTALSSVRAYMPTLAEHRLDQRIVQAGWGLCWYPAKTIAPTGLSPLVELKPAELGLDRPIALALPAAALAALALLLARRRFPGAASAALCYALAIGPLLGLTQASNQLVADRFGYLALLPAAALAAAGLARLRAAAAVPLAAVVLALLGVATWRQTRVWKDPASLWGRALAVDPDNATAHAKLGEWLLERRDPAAPSHLEAALRLNRRDWRSANNLGVWRLESGEPAAAVADFNRALALAPSEAGILTNRARARLALGEVDAALADFGAAIERDRRAAPAFCWRGWIRLQNGDGPGALEDLDAAAALAPGDFDTRLFRGIARRKTGRAEEAPEEFAAAAAVYPGEAAVYFVRAFDKAMAGDHAGARADARLAAGLADPGSTIARRARSLLESLEP